MSRPDAATYRAPAAAPPDLDARLRVTVAAVEALRGAQDALATALHARAGAVGATRLAADLLAEARIAAEATLARAERDALVIRRRARAHDRPPPSAAGVPGG